MIKEFLNFARFAGPNMTVSKSFGDKRISLRKNLNGFYTINVYDTSLPMAPDYPALYTTTGISEDNLEKEISQLISA